jgi:hypothetical protein
LAEGDPSTPLRIADLELHAELREIRLHGREIAVQPLVFDLLLHRAEILSIRGDLAEAAREIGASTALLPRWAPWAAGDAHRVLGDLRLAQGDLAGAEAAYQESRLLGWDPQPGYSILLQQQRHHDAAQSSMEAAISDRTWVTQEPLSLLLAHLAIVAARAGRPQRAATALTDLEALPGRTPAVEAVM